MVKKPLIGVSICAVVLLVLGSLSNVGGIENVKGCDCGDPPCWPELSGIMGDNNWYVSIVVVTFKGTLNYTSYRINGSNWINYEVPFTLISQGIHLLEWTCDSNMSNISSIEIKIDWYPPILSNMTYKWIGLFKCQYNINASDEFSGVNYVEFPFGPIDTEPPYQAIRKGGRLYWRLIMAFEAFHGFSSWNAWDNAGNSIPQPSSNYYSAY